MVRNTVFITIIFIVAVYSFSMAEYAKDRTDKPVNLAKIPVIVSVEGQVVNFKKSQTFKFNGITKDINQVIEYHIKTKEPIVARAIDPVLVIGDRQVTIYRYSNSDPNVIIFTDLEPEKTLERESQEIHLQWGKSADLPERDIKDLNLFILKKKVLKTITR